MNCREVRKIAIALTTRPKHDHESILSRPWELLRPEGDVDIVQNKNFDPLVNELQRKLLVMEKYCLSAACAISSTELGQFTEKVELLLINCCKQAITSVEQVHSDLHRTINPQK